MKVKIRLTDEQQREISRLEFHYKRNIEIMEGARAAIKAHEYDMVFYSDDQEKINTILESRKFWTGIIDVAMKHNNEILVLYEQTGICPPPGIGTYTYNDKEGNEYKLVVSEPFWERLKYLFNPKRERFN